jgi:MFS family permease
VRLRIIESPLFTRVLEEKKEAKSPLIDAFRYHWKEIFLTAFARFGEQGPFYIFTTFVIAYITNTLKLPSGDALLAISIAGIISLGTIPTFSYISDRVGRRMWYLIGTVVMAIYAFPYFWILNTKNPLLIIIGSILAISLCHDWLYGPQAALISERFSTKVRYSGSSLGYQLASIAGGASPIIAAALLKPYGYSGIAVFIIILAAISFVAVFLLKEFTQVDISTDEAYGIPEE